MKIIATIGPSCKDGKIIKEFIDNGVDIFRFNFSHGSLKEFDSFKKIIRDKENGIHIMGDLLGGKIRVSDKLPYIYKIYNGEEVIVCGEDKYLNPTYIDKDKKKIIPLNIESSKLKNSVVESISMKDNTMHFKIIGYIENGIRAIVTKGGIIRAGKGCNIIGIEREAGILNEKDKVHINWCIKNKVEIICQSFVENVDDIKIIKKYIKENSINYNPIIWAKIETPKGVKNSVDILKNVDGVVIGRGDLVPEGTIIRAPIYQEKIIKIAKEFRKNDIIIGTHVLNSMRDGKRPEFSEVDSIYNMINKNVTGFLLSGETSVGKAPVQTVKFLKELIEKYKEKK